MREEWEIKVIGEVSKIINGGTPKTSVKEYWEGDINWITPKDLGKLKGVYVSETPRKISKLGLQKSSARLFKENSIILSTRAPIGHLAINQVPMSTNQGCRGIVPNSNLNVNYLFYFLKLNIKLLNDLGTGTTFKELSTKALSSIKIPIPPIAEQKQIVAILDQAFEAIDQAKANIEKNIENAKELFQSKREDYFSKLSEELDLIPIDKVCKNIFAGGDKPTNNFSKTQTKELNIPIVANAVKDNGLYGYTNKAKVTEPSITVAARGSGTGHTEYRDYPFVPIVRLIVLTPNTEIVEVEFLMYAIKNLTIARSGSAIPQLTVPMIKSYSIPTPSKEKQIEIIENLNQLEFELNQYKEILRKKIIELEELKKSILEKAFSGELTN